MNRLPPSFIFLRRFLRRLHAALAVCPLPFTASYRSHLIGLRSMQLIIYMFHDFSIVSLGPGKTVQHFQFPLRFSLFYFCFASPLFGQTINVICIVGGYFVPPSPSSFSAQIENQTEKGPRELVTCGPVEGS